LMNVVAALRLVVTRFLHAGRQLQRPLHDLGRSAPCGSDPLRRNAAAAPAVSRTPSRPPREGVAPGARPLANCRAHRS